MTEPVTVGDLRVSKTEATHPEYWSRPATIADLVSALRAEGILVVEKVEGEWPKRVLEILRYDVATLAEAEPAEILDALAEAQPFPPAGE